MANPSKIAELDGRTVEVFRKAEHNSRVRYLGDVETFKVKTSDLVNYRERVEVVEEVPKTLLPTMPPAPPVMPVAPQSVEEMVAPAVMPSLSGPITKGEIGGFHNRCQELVDQHHTDHFPTQYTVLRMTEGRKYFKFLHVSGMIVHREEGVELPEGGSAWCFVSKETGDIFKPDGWTRPAKHARGNIRDEYQGMKLMGAYGPAYLR